MFCCLLSLRRRVLRRRSWLIPCVWLFGWSEPVPAGRASPFCCDGSELKIQSVCADPIRPGCWYVIGITTIQHFDEARQLLTPIVDDQRGVSRVYRPIGPVVSADGKQIWFLETHQLFRVDIDTRQVTTFAENAFRPLRAAAAGADADAHDAHDTDDTDDPLIYLQQMCWDRTSTAAAAATAAAAVLFVSDDHGYIARVDVGSGGVALKQIPRFEGAETSPIVATNMICTQSGLLLFIDCSQTFVFSFDWASGERDILAGRNQRFLSEDGRLAPGTALDGDARSEATFCSPRAIVLSDDDRCMWIADDLGSSADDIMVRTSVLRRMSLPPEYFRLRHCCDRDNS